MKVQSQEILYYLLPFVMGQEKYSSRWHLCKKVGLETKRTANSIYDIPKFHSQICEIFIICHLTFLISFVKLVCTKFQMQRLIISITTLMKTISLQNARNETSYLVSPLRKKVCLELKLGSSFKSFHSQYIWENCFYKRCVPNNDLLNTKIGTNKLCKSIFKFQIMDIGHLEYFNIFPSII